MQQRFVHITKGTANQNVSGVAKLFFAQDAVQVGQAAAAQVFGHVHAVQAKGLGLVVQGLGLGVVKGAGLLDLVFERLAFFGNETAHRFDQHFLFVVE